MSAWWYRYKVCYWRTSDPKLMSVCKMCRGFGLRPRPHPKFYKLTLDPKYVSNRPYNLLNKRLLPRWIHHFEWVSIGCLQSTIFSYMTAHRCAGGLKKKLDLRSGSHAIDISFGSLTCPSKHRHGPNLLTVIPINCLNQSLLTTRIGIQKTYFHLKPRVPREDNHFKIGLNDIDHTLVWGIEPHQWSLPKKYCSYIESICYERAGDWPNKSRNFTVQN